MNNLVRLAVKSDFCHFLMCLISLFHIRYNQGFGAANQVLTKPNPYNKKTCRNIIPAGFEQ